MNVTSQRRNEWVIEACNILKKSSINFSDSKTLDSLISLLIVDHTDSFIKKKYSYQYLRTLVRTKTLPDLAKKTSPTHGQFVKAIQAENQSLNKAKIEHFVFPVNVLPPPSTKYKFDNRYRMRNIEIRWLSVSQFKYTKYCRNTDFTSKFAGHYRKAVGLYRGSFVIIKLHTGDAQFGADRAHEILHEFLGLINLSIYFQRWIERWGADASDTISDVTGSPHFYRYEGRIKYVEPWMTDDIEFTIEKTLDDWQYKKFHQFYRSVKKVTKRCDVYKQIHSFLSMYNKGIVTSSKHSSFLIMWGLLEMLTFPGKRDNNITMIKKIRGIYVRDNLLFLDRLEYFRSKRNNMVHEIDINIDIEELNLLRVIVERLFEFILEEAKNGHTKDRILFMMENGHKDKKRLRMERKVISHLEKVSKRV